MQSILITGGNLEKRKERATEKAKIKHQASDLDIFILEGENSIGIDKIRKLERWASRKPYLSRLKSVIIPKAEKLTQEAQNALLKTLEEPPKNTLIILTAPHESFLLPTIVSRCKIIRLKEEPEIKLDKETIDNLLHVTCYMLHAGAGERIKKAQETAKTREETIVFLNQLAFLLREILLAKSSSSCLTQTQAIVYLCVSLSNGQIVEMIKSLLETKNMVEKNVNFKLALENFFLDLPAIKC